MGMQLFKLWRYPGPEWHLEDLFIIRPLQRIMSFISRTVGCKCRESVLKVDVNSANKRTLSCRMLTHRSTQKGGVGQYSLGVLRVVYQQ